MNGVVLPSISMKSERTGASAKANELGRSAPMRSAASSIC